MPPSATGMVSRVDRGAVHDGPGLRTVVFLKGCPLRCLWCHSPETQSSRPEVLLRADRCIDCRACLAQCASGATRIENGASHLDRRRCRHCGACADVCPTGARLLSGHPLAAEEILAEVLRDRVFFDQSGGGITISGGEPLAQPRFTLGLLARCRQEGIHTAVETCGYVSRRALLEAATLTDLFLFDIKAVDDRRHRELTGASNRRILGNLQTLAAAHPNVIVRYPMVPSLNDDLPAVAALGEFAAAAGIKRIDVLPYHRTGIAKYERLGRTYALPHLYPPAPEAVDRAVQILRAYRIDVTAGGVR